MVSPKYLFYQMGWRLGASLKTSKTLRPRMGDRECLLTELCFVALLTTLLQLMGCCMHGIFLKPRFLFVFTPQSQRCSCWCVYDFDDEIFIAEHETKSHTVKTSLCLYQTCTNIFPNSNCFHQQLIISGDLQSANFKVSAILNSESEWPLFFESCWSVCALCACLAPDLSFE